MRDEVAGQPIEQLGAPRLPVHFVGVGDDAVAEQPGPDAVDQRARQPAEAWIDEGSCCRSTPIGQGVGKWRAGQLREEEAGLRIFLLRYVTPIQLQCRLRREVRGERVGIVQLPLADEAVVAGIALEVYAEEDLRGVLRSLHPRLYRGAGLAAPVDTDQEAVGIRRPGRFEQPRDEAVVGQVGDECGVQPGRDALAPRGLREITDPVLVAEQIVPERDPVVSVFRGVRQQRPHQSRPFFWTAVGDERLERLG